MSALFRRLFALQFVRFCLVGASSTALDVGSLYILALVFEDTVPWFIIKTITFCVGVTNGFFWNRMWTFQAQSFGSKRAQYPKFVITNAIGLLINLSVAKVVLVFLTGELTHSRNPEPAQLVIASLCSIPISVIWNFSVARFWTFRAPKVEAENPPDEVRAPIASPRGE